MSWEYHGFCNGNINFMNNPFIYGADNGGNIVETLWDNGHISKYTGTIMGIKWGFNGYIGYISWLRDGNVMGISIL